MTSAHKTTTSRRLWIVLLVLVANSSAVIPITNKRNGGTVRFLGPVSSRVFKRAGDWEDGLREATTQALLREHVQDPDLRRRVYSAPIIGKQDRATPFGDVAVVARGQLYASHDGLAFVQDPYENDCEECHNADEVRPPGAGAEGLVALWTVKRIRHRESREIPRYEMEFTISPRRRVYRQLGGGFDYAAPGHVFVMRADHRQPLREGAFVAQTPDGRKYVLQNFPDFRAPTRPPAEEQEDEKSVYQTLLDIINKKTVEPHRFFPSTKPAAETTLVQLPNGQLVPITRLTSPYSTETTPGYTQTSAYVRTKPVPSFTRPNHVHPTETPPKVPARTTFHFFSASEDDEDLEDVFRTSTRKPATSFDLNIVETAGTRSTTAAATASFRPSPEDATVEVLPSTRLPAGTTVEFLPSTGSFTSSALYSTVTQTKPPRYPTTPYYRTPLPHQTSTRFRTTDEEPSTIVAKLTTQHYSTQPPTTLLYRTPTPSRFTTTAPNEFVETSVGVTRIMGFTRNDTTDTVYIAAEDNEISSPRESTFPTTTTTATPQRIVTTISADGKVSVETTPIFGTRTTPTARNTRRQRTRTTTEKSDFLIDAGVASSGRPSYFNSIKDYDDDAIFGTVKPRMTKPAHPKTTTKEYTMSDVEVALFGRGRRQKSPNVTTEKPIRSYSRLYEVPTSPMTPPMMSTTFVPPLPPVTSQSYKTSISFEVNKRRKEAETTAKADKEVTRALDQFAAQLVNHARGIEILTETTTPGTKKPKYTRRRSYVPKSKRPVRKKST